MIRVTTSILALTLAAGTAMAESHTNMEEAEQNVENAAEETGQAIENTAEAAGNAAENAGEEIEQAAENAGEEVEDAAETAANEVEEEASEMADNGMEGDEKLIRTRDITGGAVYSVENGQGVEDITAADYTQVEESWNRIGEIEDIVLTESGELRGMVLEVGGFLNIGDKHIFMPVEDVQLVPVDDRTYALAVGQSEEELEQRESVDEGFWN